MSPREPAPSRARRLLACRAHAVTYAALLLAELLLWVRLVGGGAPAVRAAGLWIAGVLLWTLLEYLLHRFAFHLPPSHALAVLGAHQHHAHHAEPDRGPITKPLRLTLPALALGYAAALQFADPATVTAAWAGLIAGYLGYELSHVATHVLGPSEHPLPAFQRAHLDHHRDARSNFGITSPLWDLLLGTFRRR